MKKLSLYNTQTRRKEKIIPLNETVLFYTCGPTVYDFAHIGNLRTYVFEDLLKRTFLFLGFSVKHVMNLTDIDDKTIRGALAKKLHLSEYTKPYIDAFFKDIETLNILKADHYPRATEYIEEMIQMIQTLLDKGYAYIGSDQSIYFSIHKFSDYGKLSHFHLDELKKGASERDRLTQDEYDKENASDFVLWKSYDEKRDGSIFWESPFGKGRPGWHIECSAMAMNLLGKTIDLHVGGVDNIFPHHENEIAQSECCSGDVFVKHWAHAEHLVVDGKKMSKSLGNFYTLRDLLEKKYTPLEMRYMLMQVHYRTKLNFTLEGLVSARSSLSRIHDFVYRLKQIEQKEKGNDAQDLALDALKHFTDAMADDLNISVALSSLFDLIRDINILADQNKIGKEEALFVLDILRKMDTVLGILSVEEEKIPEMILEALEKRQKARLEKKWQEADQYRDLILSEGYIIDDTPTGSRVKKKNSFWT